MKTAYILDDQGEMKNISYSDAETGKRFLNYIIDTLAFYIIYFILSLLFVTFFPNSNLFADGPASLNGLFLLLLTLLIYIVYYAFQEYFLDGKTLGKYLTKTRAVNQNNSNLSFEQALARSACRLIPFEPFSFLGNKPGGWHDRMSETRVIEDRNWWG
jgi:uncharacterized RDD family membrane protein YckC